MNLFIALSELQAAAIEATGSERVTTSMRMSTGIGRDDQVIIQVQWVEGAGEDQLVRQWTHAEDLADLALSTISETQYVEWLVEHLRIGVS